tara:strand:+ start:19771 stop:21291 length:1521 start_codon:yes stop_codon:yes gene_type:complete
MTSSYTVNNGLEKPEAGDQEGAWGGTLNTNFDIIDRVLSGVGSISLSGTTHTLTTTDGTLTDGMYRVLVFTGALGANNTVTISPNDQDKLYFIVNNTTDSGSSGPYSVIIKQGTGDTVTVENGRADIVYADGAGSGAAVVSLGTQIGKQSFDVFNYVATAGQTTFSGADAASQTLAYSVGNLFVTVNGTVLKTGTDYTATNGTSIVLTDAATVGDEISIFAFNTFSVGPSKTITLFKYSATAGQTTFSGSDSASQTLAYTAGMIIVTLNGVVLDTSDYTATNGTSVVLDSGASTSDELNIIAFTAFNSASVTTASADFSIGDDLSFTSDGAIINMGADSDVTMTHVHNKGVQFNTMPITPNPCFFARLGSNQTVSSGVVSKATLDTEDFDVGGYFDNSTNYRFTPLIQGYYQFNLQLYDLSNTDNYDIIVYLYKNGASSNVSGRIRYYIANGDLYATVCTASGILYADGVDDYFEMYFRGVSEDAGSIIAGASWTNMNGVLVSRTG